MSHDYFTEKECEYCDYKLKWHDNKARLLHDLLCLSNADSKNSRQLIFGVSDGRKGFPGVCEDPNRMTQASCIDWLRKLKLNCIPKTTIEIVRINDLEFDILKIENCSEKPYFLTESYRNGKVFLAQGSIYTRDKDVNTALDRCATDSQIEKMYMERLGILDEHHRLVNTVLEEADYNRTPGVGDNRCPFRLSGHHELLSSRLRDRLPKETLDLLRETARIGGLCNGGRIGGAARSGIVKEKSAQLIENLNRLIT